MIARLLACPPSDDTGLSDALSKKCKEDVAKLMLLLQNNNRGSLKMQKTRLEVLQAAFARILV